MTRAPQGAARRLGLRRRRRLADRARRRRRARRDGVGRRRRRDRLVGDAGRRTAAARAVAPAGRAVAPADGRLAAVRQYGHWMAPRAPRIKIRCHGRRRHDCGGPPGRWRTRGVRDRGAVGPARRRSKRAASASTIWCGTSVGAINATMLASLAHLPRRASRSRSASSRWARDAQAGRDRADRGAGRRADRRRGSSAHALGVRGIGLASLLDAVPARCTASTAGSTGAQLAANVAPRRRRGGVRRRDVAGERRPGRVRVDRASGAPAHADDAIRYVKTRSTASTCAPRRRSRCCSRPSRSRRPRAAARPLHRRRHAAEQPDQAGAEPRRRPRDRDRARAVRAARLAGRRTAARPGSPTSPRTCSTGCSSTRSRPTCAGSRRSTRSSPRARAPAPRARRARTGPRAATAPYRPISYALVAPRRRGEIGRLAESVFERRYGGLRGLRDLDYVRHVARARRTHALTRRAAVVPAVRPRSSSPS